MTRIRALKAYRRQMYFTAILLAGVDGQAHAQVEQSTPQANLASDRDIVVTAQKRLERLQDVPVPVSVVQAGNLAARNQTSLKDYFAAVPGLSIDAEGSGQTNIIIRGIATGSSQNPTVGILIDDVPFGSVSVLGFGSLLAPDLDPASLERVEILRGPQGTLYGASSMGGLIKYVTIDPSTAVMSGHAEADLNGTVGGGMGYGVRAGVNVPLSDTFAIRGDAFSRRTPGYVRNVPSDDHNVNAADVSGGRVAALWKPVDMLSIKLTALLQDSRGKGGDTVTTSYDEKPLYGGLSQYQPRTSGKYHSTVQLYTGKVELRLPFADLISVSGYGVNRYIASTNFPALAPDAGESGAGATILDRVLTKKFTQEVRLSSNKPGFLDWIIGGFYDDETTNAQEETALADLTSGRVLQTLGSYRFPTSYREYAVFGDVTLNVTNRFDIQGGVRYSHNDQTYRERDEDYSGPETAVATFSAKSSDDSTTFLVSPRFRFSSDLMAYVRIASGYRPGGPNAAIPSDSLIQRSYKADTTLSYDVGLKGKAFNKRLTFSLAAYNIEWSDIQTQLVDPISQFLYFTNAGHARSRGVEAETTLKVSDTLQVSLTANYNRSILTEDLPGTSAMAAFKGDRLPYNPKWQGSLSIDKQVALPGDWKGSFGGAVSYVGSRFGIFANDPTQLRVRLNDYAKLDLHAGIEKHGWSVTVFANNVTNSRGALSLTSQLGSESSRDNAYDAVFIQPTNVGVSIGKTF